MKNNLCILAFLAFPAMLFAQAWYGTGNPYTISTEADLIGLQQLVSSQTDNFEGDTILLGNDIALTGNWTPIGGSSGSSSYPFKGTFDGQGKTISGLKVSGDYDYAGLFGYVGAGGQIKNLNVVAPTIETTRNPFTSYAGGLVGYYASSKPIENCSVEAASITSKYMAGGLVGRADSAFAITNSYASGNIVATRFSNMPSNAGGLVGYVSRRITITNSYAIGNVSAGGSTDNPGAAGGLVGKVDKINILNSYTNVNVTANGIGYGGGLVGYITDSSGVTYCYASGNVSATYRGGIFGKWEKGSNTRLYFNNLDGTLTVPAGAGSPSGWYSNSSANLKKRATYYRTWDFDDIWGIIEDVSYPYLKTNPHKITVPIYGGLEAEYLPMQTYTGSRITPELTVRKGSATLTEGTDYLLTYGENKNAGIGTVTIIAIDNNMGTEESVFFDIIPKTITITDAAAQDKIYDNTTEAVVTGTLHGVAEGDNLSCESRSVSSCKGEFVSSSVGTRPVSNVTLVGASAANYKLIQPTGLTAQIAKRDLTITLSPKTVEIKISDPISRANFYIIYIGRIDNYQISGKSAICIDEVELTATPKAGIYPVTLCGDRSSPTYNITYDNEDLFLKVTGTPVNLSTCAVADIPAQDYAGEQITPADIAVTCGTTLVSEANYTISYGDNKNAGATAGRVIITANAESAEFYTGSIEKTFAITPKALTVAGAQVSDKVYDGTTEATITGTPALEGVFEGDTSDVSISSIIGAFATANAGTDIDVSINASLSGAAAENYSVTQLELTGTITAKPLTQDLIQAIVSQTYTGSEITPSITVMDGSNILAIDTDYTLSITENINVGTASVSIAGIGNYAGTLDTTFEILPKELSNSMIAAIADQQYTGEEIIPDITVSDGNMILVAGTDYEVSYSNNVNAGSASASITGKGNYAGEASPIAKTFAINPKALTITGAQVTGKIYDGTTAAEITGATVEGILEGDIENVSISSITGAFANANAGTEINVSINAFLSGAAAANYSIIQPELKGTITAKPLAEDAIQAIASQTYTGSAITPSVTVKDGSNILAVGSDYTLSVINNINTGTASVLVTGKGNYKGTADAAFAITPKNLSSSMIAEIANQFYTGEPITPHITVKDGVRTLAEGTDYEISYSNNTNTGFASVSITGKGNYASEATAYFGITEPTPIRTPQIAASQIQAQSAANAIMLQNLPQNAKIEAYTMQGERIYMGNSVNSQILRIVVQTKEIYVIKVSLGSQKQILKVPVR